MASIEYSLFRVKFIKPQQTSFLHDILSPQQVFLKAIEERPSAELRPGYIWHIGNVHPFDTSGGYFAVGRTTNATIAKYDGDTGDFVEEELETSPYTHAVFDSALGLLAIAAKPSLAPTTLGIADKLAAIFRKTTVVTKNELSVEIPPIPNPTTFLKRIASAYSVMQFTATFRGPNPFDADELFQKPLSVYLREARGNGGKTVIYGKDLNREVVTAVARSTAATGNNASAQIQTTSSQAPTTIRLKGDVVTQRFDEKDHEPQKVLDVMRQRYKKVRSDD